MQFFSINIRIFILALSVVGVPSFAQQGDFDVFETNITELQEAMESGEVNSVGLVLRYLARIRDFDQEGPALNSVVGINSAALERAAELDAERAATGPRSLLHGIPILVKDNYNVLGMATSGGSVGLANFMPSANSTQVQRLLDAGAIVLGKTNLHEFAYGITTVGSLFGQTLNPYDIRRVPGGSSGGTGAAIAASFAAVGLGSDTCGSIRIPSAFNNLVGLRPSKGLSSIYGVMPLSHTQDVAGPLARNAEDLAIVLDIVSGADSNDSATALMQNKPAPEFLASLGSVRLSELRLGRLDEYFDSASSAVRNTLEETLEWLESQGAEVVSVEIPEMNTLISDSGLITFEFRDDLNDYLEEFGSADIENLAEIIEQGLYHQAVEGALNRSNDFTVIEAAYADRVNTRTQLRNAVESVLEEHQLDALVYPTIGQLPVLIGDPQTGSNCSLSANSGLPAISFPAGFSANELPVGVELLGAELSDAELVAIAYAVEQQKNSRRAPVVTPSRTNPALYQNRNIDISYSEGEVEFVGLLEFMPLQNILRYRINLQPESVDLINAITLSFLPEMGDSQMAPIVHNLVSPNSSGGSGDYFMSAEFREAFLNDRVRVRIFATGLPAQGVSWWPDTQ